MQVRVRGGRASLFHECERRADRTAAEAFVQTSGRTLLCFFCLFSRAKREYAVSPTASLASPRHRAAGRLFPTRPASRLTNAMATFAKDIWQRVAISLDIRGCHTSSVYAARHGKAAAQLDRFMLIKDDSNAASRVLQGSGALTAIRMQPRPERGELLRKGKDVCGEMKEMKEWHTSRARPRINIRAFVRFSIWRQPHREPANRTV